MTRTPTTAGLIKAGLIAASLAALTACGGTGGVAQNALSPQERAILAASQSAGNISNGKRLSLRQIADVAGDVNKGYNAVGITPKASVPGAGSATYRGAVGGDVTVNGDTDRIAGLMELGANFSTNRVGGFVGNFVDEDGRAINGTLAVTNGQINRTSNSRQVAIFADVDGTVSAGNARSTIDAKLKNSGFKGPNAEFIGGDIQGTVRGTAGNGTIDLRTQLVR